ncbi:MAG TPA: tyrosine-type recombinase/integrase [Pyrinomonadaceae bacterium]|jgi:site-specific recombinase XerD|nr:tyrosine-type recombinase/integrase [Pyrinomonadaceae bacterium]
MTYLIRQDAATEIAIQTVLDSLDSPHSRRAYERHLRRFFAWHQVSGHPVFNKAIVQRYAAELRESGLSAATINQRLSAIRKLAGEAADNGALDAQLANGIRAIKGIRQEGTRTGNWLTKEQAQEMLSAPDTRTLKGLRDRAILALLIGCGLRRAEASGMTFGHIQQRDGRWVLVDIIGKRNKIRSVPMPNWTKQAIEEYAKAADLVEGIVFRPVNKAGRMAGERMSEQAIYNVVGQYAEALSLGNIAPHDLRRSFAKLAHKGGSGIDQIQLSLGHGSIQTTERYLGTEQDLTNAPCDHLGLRL